MGNASKALAIGAAAFVMAHAAGAHGPSKLRQRLPGRPGGPLHGRHGGQDARRPALGAKVVRYSENSVPMAIGDGLWATISAHSRPPCARPTPAPARRPGSGRWTSTVSPPSSPCA